MNFAKSLVRGSAFQQFATGAFFVFALSVVVTDADAASKKKAKSNVEADVEFTEEVLGDQAVIDIGAEVWQEQCRHCHGNSAYPGKAPKLKPKRYKPSFVFKRVTDGFRKMPAWFDVYSKEERVGVVAYIMSKQFKP